MVDVVTRKCLDCDTIPIFNYKREKFGLYCVTHKKDKMVNVVTPVCNACDLFIVQKKGDMCDYCDPESIIQKQTKEMIVKTLLEENNIQFIHNRTVSNDCCLKYRPDFVIDCINYFIVLEVDEHAHRSYDPDCEISRMNNISHSLGLPTKFLRYNPDLKRISEKDKEEILITTLNTLINNFDNDLTVEYLFYN